MQRKIWRVIEAARDLKLHIVSSGAEEKVRIRGSAREFPGRLLALQKALDELDGEGGLTLSENARINLLESELVKYRIGIDHVFRWMKENGIDITEPYALLEESLGVPEKKRAKAFTHKPEYGKKKGKKKPNQAGEDKISDRAVEEPMTGHNPVLIGSPEAETEGDANTPEPAATPAPGAPSPNGK